LADPVASPSLVIFPCADFTGSAAISPSVEMSKAAVLTARIAVAEPVSRAVPSGNAGPAGVSSAPSPLQAADVASAVASTAARRVRRIPGDATQVPCRDHGVPDAVLTTSGTP
jgi:hypothetical protein